MSGINIEHLNTAIDTARSAKKLLVDASTSATPGATARHWTAADYLTVGDRNEPTDGGMKGFASSEQ